jgi:DNA topoisomerase-2
LHDAVERTELLVAGQNGLGVKLANIFSTKFTVAVRDVVNGKLYECTWTDGMQRMGTPKIKSKEKPTTGYVDVLFYPNSVVMGEATEFSEDVKGVLAKRAVDASLAARDGVRVWFNDEKIPEMKLKRYVQLFSTENTFQAVDEESKDWRVAVMSTDDAFTVGMVNGTSAVGSHVTYVESKLYSAILEALKTKREFKGVDIKLATIKSHVGLFVVANVSKPTFDSQVKEKCVSYDWRASSYYNPSEAFIKKIVASPIVARVLEDEKVKTNRKLAQKTDGKMTTHVDVPKLLDASWAGTARASLMSLILTEGDSARTFAVAGLPVLGHDKFGVFPLRGKLLNVREASAEQLMKNEEITHLKQILGLKEKESHAHGSGLRYGSIIILTDSDHDGSHIRGLILNFLHAKWPELAKSRHNNEAA